MASSGHRRRCRRRCARYRRRGEEINEWWASQAQYWGEIQAKGIPLAYAGWDWPPFDILGDTLRGTHQILADMRRRPDKLHDALEVATKIFIEYGSGAAGAPLPFCWVWVHKSTREFMSDAQFKEFYWPYLRKGLLGLIEKGVTPVIYWEADFESRLEHIVDVPAGKIIYHLSNTNAQKAKAVLGGHRLPDGQCPQYHVASRHTGRRTGVLQAPDRHRWQGRRLHHGHGGHAG